VSLLNLDASGNPNLTSLNVANGNNTNMTTFDVTNNPNLSCIQVDDVAWSTSNWTVSNSNIDATASFSLNCTTSTSTIYSKRITMTIFPNPSHDILKVQCNDIINLINIYTLEGKLIKSINTNNSISVSNLSSGTYMVQVITEKGIGSQFFVKQ
jgi:hypothetical protein